MKKKYKKFKKSTLKKFEFKANNLKYGDFGLKAAQSGIIKSSHLLAAKQAILKKIKKRGKLWVNIHTNLSISSKPVGSRMGKGKGAISHWVTKISCGNVLFEISSSNFIDSFHALKIAKSKLPIKTKIIYGNIKKINYININWCTKIFLYVRFIINTKLFYVVTSS